MNVRDVVYGQLEAVAKEQNKTLAPLTDDMELLETGLDSLCIAIVVARLEDVLLVDPFSTDEETMMPVTIGQFVKLYQNAVPA